jgi:hypothetical protein
MIKKIMKIINKYKNIDISFEYYTDNTKELEKIAKDDSFVGTKGWGFEGYYDDSKYISCCESAKNEVLNKIIMEIKSNGR